MIKSISKKPLILILGAFILVGACKKKTGNIILPDQLAGNNADPNTESLTLKTSSIAEDSFVTEGLPYKLLGVMDDLNFGQSKSDAYSEFTITDLNPSLNATGNTLDSAVLTIRFTSTTAFYGNLSTAQNFTVHKLTEAFPAGDIYSNQKLNHETTPIGTFNGVIDLSDSTSFRTGNTISKISPCFRVKLTAAAANELFNAPATSYASDANFKTFFKGIVIKSNSNPASGDGGIFGLIMDDNLSKITIHYNDSLSYSLNMKSSRSFANYEIQEQNPSITNQHNASTMDYNVVYAQSLTGSKIRVEIPNLESLAMNKTKVVHKAELHIKPLAGSFSTTYPLPQRILVLQPDSSGRSIAIPDLFSGKFNGDLQNEEYILNVTEFIQFQINTFKSTGALKNVLHVVVPNSNPIAPSRIQVDADKLQPKISLKVVYSEL